SESQDSLYNLDHMEHYQGYISRFHHLHGYGILKDIFHDVESIAHPHSYQSLQDSYRSHLVHILVMMDQTNNHRQVENEVIHLPDLTDPLQLNFRSNLNRYLWNRF